MPFFLLSLFFICVDTKALMNAVWRCTLRGVQDPDEGGIADRPDNVTDVFHTVFGCAGKSYSILSSSLQADYR